MTEASDRAEAADRAAFGDTLRRLRTSSGKSRAALAAVSGVPLETIKKYETGERGIPRPGTLAKLAMGLGLTDLRQLIGGPVGMPIATGVIPMPAVAQIKTAVRGAPRAALPPRVPDALELDQRADAGWRTWHASPFQRTQAGELLPGLISDAHSSVRMAENIPARRRAAAAMTQIYALTLLAIGYVCEADLYWTVLDRVTVAAQDADDPLSLGLSGWCQGLALRYSADPHEAISLMAESITALEPYAGDSQEAQALLGALHLGSATSLAQDGYAGRAWGHLDKADAIAQRLPEGYWHHPTVFSQQNVGVHTVAVDAALTRLGDALARAERIDPNAVPSTERTSRLLIDAAIAYHHRGEDHAAVNRLQAALARGPENTMVVPAARSLVMDLQTTRPASLAAEVEAIVEKMQMQPA